MWACNLVSWSPQVLYKIVYRQVPRRQHGGEAELPTGDPPSPFSAEETYGD